MSSEDLKRRLEQMNGGPLETEIPTAPRQRRSAKRKRAIPSGPGMAQGSIQAPQVREPGPVAYGFPDEANADPAMVLLEHAAPGRLLETPDGGTCWFIEKPVRSIGDWCAEAMERTHRALARGGASVLGRGSAMATVHGLSDLLFLDLETLGLGPEPLFLIGTLQWEGNELLARQYFARNPDEEGPAISAFVQGARGYRAMATFNGISFDHPYLLRRAAARGIGLRCPRGHLDLLLAARERYRRRLPNCKLQTLETHLCGRQRDGDIPGALIPAAYAAFMRTGNAHQIASILEHNILDLMTTLDLIGIMLSD